MLDRVSIDYINCFIILSVLYGVWWIFEVYDDLSPVFNLVRYCTDVNPRDNISPFVTTFADVKTNNTNIIIII